MADRFPDIPGLGFFPTDVELLNYLKLRIQEHFQGVASSNPDIRDIDPCSCKPWDLPNIIKSLSPRQGSNWDEWYFFCARKDKSSGKSSTRTVPNVGYWKVTSRKQDVGARKLTGTKSILSFKRSDGSSSSNNDSSTWVIHEYNIDPSCLGYNRGTTEMPFVACCLKNTRSSK